MIRGQFWAGAGPPLIKAVLPRAAAQRKAVAAERVVVTFPAGDWYRQASLLAEAAGTVGAASPRPAG